uniref:Tc1-like transposase DDE domain-containing protein n=1 Tax=Cyprinus carpio carpio TaxID=630221 RepID=A0A8C1DLE8_CYPCA
MLQHDNARPHVARICTQFLEAENILVLAWPAYSPDMSPIKHVWDALDRCIQQHLRALDVHPTNLHQLQDAILSIWANISKECFQHLVGSMPRRIKAVLKVKGGQSQY